MSTFPSKYEELRPENRECPACLHPRLLHDSWGCVSRCGCQVGIVQLTKKLFAIGNDPKQDKERLAIQRDAVAEQDLKSNKIITERLRGEHNPQRSTREGLPVAQARSLENYYTVDIPGVQFLNPPRD